MWNVEFIGNSWKHPSCWIGTWKIGHCKNLDFLEVNESFILTRWFLENLLSFHIRPHYPCHSQDPKHHLLSPLSGIFWLIFLVIGQILPGGPRGGIWCSKCGLPLVDARWCQGCWTWWLMLSWRPTSKDLRKSRIAKQKCRFRRFFLGENDG